MLGSSLCSIYHNEHEVYAFHRDNKCYSYYSIDYSIDLKDLSKLSSLFRQIQPDLVIHCAGLTNLDICEKNPLLAKETNVNVSENIAQACSNKTKLVYISTDQVYGDAKDRSENNKKLQPVNHYGKTKLQGELKIQQLCDEPLIVRTNIFGWNVKPGMISSAEWIYRSIKNKEEITLFSDYIFSPIYTKCLGEMIMKLVEMGFTGLINAGSPESCSKYDFGLSLADIFGLDILHIQKGSINDLCYLTKRPRNLILDVNKLLNLGISVTTYKDSLKKFRANAPVIKY